MAETLELQSGAARRWLLEGEIMTSEEEIRAAYEKLADFHAAFGDDRKLRRLRDALAPLKDISGTIARLSGGATLDDVALFEVKELCLLASAVAEALAEAGVGKVEVPDLSEALSLLDPEGLRVPSFFVYDNYSPLLKELRAKLRRRGEDHTITSHILAEEEEVRGRLSGELKRFAPALSEALRKVIEVDILQAKAEQMRQLGLTFPDTSHSGRTKYQKMFHPQVRAMLERQEKEFQPVEIEFGGEPVTIVGANMGGKTVALKMAALNQLLFQFGFGIPAQAAEIDIKEDIILYIGDEECPERGLSAFGAEVGRIGAMIERARAGERNLVLIDEPARTTNPEEGTALVEALLAVMSDKRGDLIITTHYNIAAGTGRRLRVRGFVNGAMDYSLEEVRDASVPREAISVAESLGGDGEWLDKAKELIKRP